MLQPGPAIWRTDVYDVDVEIVRYLGTTDGVRYYMIRNDSGETGVPETELIVKKQNIIFDWADIFFHG
ncbi:MAG: hypothetical protein A2381_15225 [Bdellovibrionales bacterium RIFOXYB1_FULL_37_110]|nr:MAG: hypothetical protein A2381_15225 [Bdellovibrionales bacterium RIFOXYB1_FULL_37_110]